jgi:hypothetical protein
VVSRNRNFANPPPVSVDDKKVAFAIKKMSRCQIWASGQRFEPALSGPLLGSVLIRTDGFEIYERASERGKKRKVEKVF